MRFPRVLDDIQGKMVIVVDDEDRENEGDLVAAAEKPPLPPSISWRSLTRAYLRARI
ncbi:MAG: 3,4-dihydroxy-2-butanone-4-phosphate synthase [Verrucomicrobiota bacterium]